MPTIRLFQHIYTSGKREFATIAATQGFSREDRLKLERQSVYLLPGSLLYKENQPTPTKYVFYKLSEEKLVVGKAIYMGKDSLGRPGNYLFHNFVLAKEDLMKLDLNPIKLIKLLQKKHLFKNSAPQKKSLDIVELSIDEFEEVEPKPFTTNIELILNLLYTCFNFDILQRPLLLQGDGEEILNFLDWLFNLLPYNLREKLSFDTYSYGVSLGFNIVGLPCELQFQQSLSGVLNLNLSTQQYTIDFELKEPSKIISFVAERSALGKIDEISSLYSLQYYLQKSDFVRFRKGYKSASSLIKEFLYTLHRQDILQYILAQKDRELLELIIDMLSTQDINILSSDFGLIQSLIERERRNVLELFAAWLCTQPNKETFYPLLFTSYTLWQIFLERIRHFPEETKVLIQVLKIFPRYYSLQFEEALVKTMLPMFTYLKSDKRLARSLTRTLLGFPEPHSESIKLLRTYLRYELTKDSLLLNELINSDISILSEDQQSMVLRRILEGILRGYKFEEIPLHLDELLRRAHDRQGFLLHLLNLMETIKISDKMKETLKETIFKFLEGLPQDETIERIKERTDQIFQPKPSFLSRIGDLSKIKDIFKLRRDDRG